MSEILALPTALDALDLVLGGSTSDQDGVLQVLRVLQRLGLTREELTVHIERRRAVNDVTDDDTTVEDACLLALDLVAGGQAGGLAWSPTETARAVLPRCLDAPLLAAALPYALAPSDLLPPRAIIEPGDDLAQSLVGAQLTMLSRREYAPTPAEFFRAPRTGLTSRPAALLAPQDRFAYEALAQAVASRLDDVLPHQVVWPRGRGAMGDHDRFVHMPAAWSGTYIVRTDVQGFFEHVDHGILALLIAQTLNVRGSTPLAIEALLDAVMSAPAGLPQGPPGSDVLGAAYLADIDRLLADRGWEFARYADDILFAASSVADARRRLHELEDLLRERGLRLAADKTRVLKSATYAQQLGTPSRSVQRFRDRLRQRVEANLRNAEDAEDAEEILRGAGADEEVLWDLLYHHSVTVEEVIEQMRDRLAPPWVDAYRRYFISRAQMLTDGEYPEHVDAEERDLRECLAVLTGSVTLVPLHVLNAVLDWYPRLAQAVSSYLLATVLHGGADPLEVAEFVGNRASMDADSDHALAWLLWACRPRQVALLMVPTLLKWAERDDKGLTRASALSTLASIGRLPARLWQVALDDARRALRAELLLARQAQPEGYPEGTNDALLGLPEGTNDRS